MTSLARATGVGLSNFRGNIPVYRRSFSTNALNQISERLRASSAFGDVWFRTYSQVANYPKNDAEYGKTIYISLQESTTEEKTEKVFLKTLENALGSFDLVEKMLSPTKSWDLLRMHLSQYHSYKLPLFSDSYENLQALLAVFRRPLIKENLKIDKPTLSDYIFTPTELFWGLDQVGVPFTRSDKVDVARLLEIEDILKQCPFPESLPTAPENLSETERKIQLYSLLSGEKDATAAILLAVPHLDETTLLHEVGCWNGQNLLNLLFYSAIKKVGLKYCIGTDINYRALTMAQSVASLLSIHEPFVQFHLSNALYPLNPNHLKIDFQKEVRLALRLIPVLDLSSAKTFLLKTRNSLKSSKDVVIISYAIPKGLLYENNLSRVGNPKKPGFTKEEFSGGVTFYQEFSHKKTLDLYLPERKDDRAVLNTYYTQEGFAKLIRECGFKMKHAIKVHDTNNDRIVELLNCE